MSAEQPTARAVSPGVPALADLAVPVHWMRPLLVGLIVFVVTVAFRSSPGPGFHGDHLAVVLSLVGLIVGTTGFLLAAESTSLAVAGFLLVLILAGATLVAFQPNGPGFLAIFPAASVAALRLPIRWSSAVAATAVAALAVGWGLSRHPRVAGIVQIDIGVLAIYSISLFARRLRESNEQAQQLIVELDGTRAAQAQAAALSERQRLAREMHDVLAHTLSGLALNLESARLLAARAGTDLAVSEAIDRAHHLAKTGLEEARRAIGMLRDDELPGPERLPGLAAEFERDSGITSSFEMTGEERDLTTDSRLTLYRVAQEALTNIRKHTRAERVELHLTYEASGTSLCIEDFEPNGDRPPPGDGTGYGLTGMRERAELLGGALTAGPTDRGFRVEVWVPG